MTSTSLRPNLYDHLKLIALVSMIIDHVWFMLFPEEEIYRIIGRLAFPIFLFLVWHNHSYRWSNTLWIWGGILQLGMRIGSWAGYIDMRYINILLVIALVRVVLGYIQTIQHKHAYMIEILLFISAICLVPYTQEIFDYGTLGIIFGLVWYWVKKRWYTLKSTAIILGTVAGYIWYMVESFWFSEIYVPALVGIGLFLSICFIYMSIENRSYQTGISWLDRGVVWLSSHALEIYVVQVVVLGGMWWYVG